MSAPAFSDRLLEWFDAHGRKDLPWQHDPAIYRVWISEVMLQQTQVGSVIPYYQRFVRRFPDRPALAAAALDEVLHLWSGLGYYSRARNLHRAAVLIREQHGGEFPQDIEPLMALPGIGRSTAGAILALACGQRQPILDGNVKRVLARFHAVDGWPGKASVEKELWRLAERHTPHKRVAHYTQAIMDLGATVCTRGGPDCPRCPLCASCRAHILGRVADFPAPRPRKVIPVRRTTMLLLSNPAGAILLQRRPPTGIWGGLWSLPEYADDTTDEATLHHWCRQRLGYEVDAVRHWPTFRHTFSHFHLDVTPVHGQVKDASSGVMEGGATVWYNTRQPDARGLAAPVKRLLAVVANKIEGETL